MTELITFGETMAVMVPNESGPLRYTSGFRLQMAGAESNTAIGLAKLGHSAGWISSLGCDELGQYVLSAIRGEGVDVSHVLFDENHHTGLMFKQFGRDETTVYYYRENSAASHYDVMDIPYEYIRSAKILHLTGITPVISLKCHDVVEGLIEFAKDNNILLSFDPNIRRKLWGDKDYSELIRNMIFGCDIAFLGLDEAKALLGTDNVENIVDTLIGHGVKYIAIKNGSLGAWCASKDELIHIPPVECSPIDPIGAGDGFNAGFLSGILKGRDLVICGKMGSIAGAMATETHGDINGYPSQREMEQRLNQSSQIYR